MDLYEYFEMKKKELIDITSLAEKIGCSRTYLSLVCHRRIKPSFDLCLEIEEHTNGLIAAHDQYRKCQESLLTPDVKRKKFKKNGPQKNRKNNQIDDIPLPIEKEKLEASVFDEIQKEVAKYEESHPLEK